MRRAGCGLRAVAALVLPAVLAVLAVLVGEPQAWAQISPLNPSGSDTPVEIEANESLEWQSELKVYVARGGVRLRQGDVELRAQTVYAHYRELPDGNTQIWRAVAEGAVVIQRPDGRAQADRAVYDLDRDVLVLTGRALRLEQGNDVITARDSLEYWQGRRLAVARGAANLVRGRDRVQADMMTGQFVEQPDGSLRLSVLSAMGSVLITTPTDVASGQQAVYNVDNELATLTGGVRLTRGGSQLNGEVAEMNLRTGISRLLATPGRGGRVQGLLVPNRTAEPQP